MSTLDLSFRCDVAWNSMTQNADGSRHCGECSRDVIDISRMTSMEAMRLVAEARGQVCVSGLYDRARDTFLFPADQLRRKAPALAAATAIAGASMLGGCEHGDWDPGAGETALDYAQNRIDDALGVPGPERLTGAMPAPPPPPVLEPPTRVDDRSDAGVRDGSDTHAPRRK